MKCNGTTVRMLTFILFNSYTHKVTTHHVRTFVMHQYNQSVHISTPNRQDVFQLFYSTYALHGDCDNQQVQIMHKIKYIVPPDCIQSADIVETFKWHKVNNCREQVEIIYLPEWNKYLEKSKHNIEIKCSGKSLKTSMKRKKAPRLNINVPFW